MKRRTLLTAAAALPLVSIRTHAAPAISDGVVKIGDLDDMSGVFSAQQGMGDYTSAQMAAEDFGGHVLGAPIKVIEGDLENKVDVGLSVARRWLDQEKVDAIFGLGNSAVALAVQALCAQRKKIDVVVAAATTKLTGSECSPYGVDWAYNNYSAAKGPAIYLMGEGKTTWYFITVDYAFGHSLQKNCTDIVKKLGGKVLGSTLVPLGTTDYSASLTQAAASGAKVLGVACGGADFINCVKQMAEFGLIRRGMTPAALNCSLTNIHSLGLEVAQGLVFSQPYYWDRDAASRAFAARFAKRFNNRPPTAFQASTWGAVTHYLKAVRTAGTDDGPAVMAKMRAMPINDFMTKNGHIRPDGQVSRDELLLRAKKPSQSRSEWDLLEVVKVIPGKDAFLPLSESTCPLVKS